MANLLLNVIGAFAEFERSLIRERQREGIALAKKRGAYRGRIPSLDTARAAELRAKAAAGVPKFSLDTLGSAAKPSTPTSGGRLSDEWRDDRGVGGLPTGDSGAHVRSVHG